jgi:hypothetical protein
MNPAKRHEPVALIERVALDYALHLVSPAELREFGDWLEQRQDYQIHAGRRECDSGDQIEIFVTCGEKTE